MMRVEEDNRLVGVEKGLVQAIQFLLIIVLFLVSHVHFGEA